MKYLISGASSGLGACLSQRLMQHGEVAGLSRTLGNANNFVGKYSFRHIKCDLSDTIAFDDNSNLSRQIADFIGSDEVSLILNAAAFYAGSERLSSPELDRIFNVNVITPIKLANYLQKFRLRRVLFINSVSGLIGQAFQHEYVATKHSLMGFSKSLAQTAKTSDFDVMSINPGGMKSELWNDYPNTDISDFLDVAMIAKLCEHLIMLPGSVFIENFTILPGSDV